MLARLGVVTLGVSMAADQFSSSDPDQTKVLYDEPYPTRDQNRPIVRRLDGGIHVATSHTSPGAGISGRCPKQRLALHRCGAGRAERLYPTGYRPRRTGRAGLRRWPGLGHWSGSANCRRWGFFSEPVAEPGSFSIAAI